MLSCIWVDIQNYSDRAFGTSLLHLRCDRSASFMRSLYCRSLYSTLAIAEFNFTAPCSLARYILKASDRWVKSTMLSVEGTFQGGIVQLVQPIAGRDGQRVIIIFVQEESESGIPDSAWNDFTLLLKDCQMNTGISDLAHQHDHYLHGTPKRED
ncbi:hypothetical protein [Myxacorys almedinensis]|nr:hypothetical protein [Myxacorys almedinensis]